MDRSVRTKNCKGGYAADTGAHPLQGAPKGCILGYKTDAQGQALERCLNQNHGKS